MENVIKLMPKNLLKIFARIWEIYKNSWKFSRDRAAVQSRVASEFFDFT